jgi:hypothetical protein
LLEIRRDFAFEEVVEMQEMNYFVHMLEVFSTAKAPAYSWGSSKH